MILSINENIITAHGYIWEGDGMDFVRQLERTSRLYDDIIIRLHTYGGSVFDGNLIMNALRESQSQIEIQIIGVAASMGAMLTTAVSNVKIARNGFMMIHAPSGYTSGTADAHESTAALLRSMEKSFRSELMHKTGKDEKAVGEWLKGDNWLDAQAALDEGLVSEIMDSLTDIDVEALDPKALGAKGMFNRYAAALLPKETKKPNNNFIIMKKSFINELGLKGLTEQSSDTAIIEAVKKHYEDKVNALQGKLDEQIKTLKKLEDEQKENQKKVINALLKDGREKGKITAKQEEKFKKIAQDSGIDTLREVLDAIPARASVSGSLKQEASAQIGRENWDFDKWQKEDPNGLEAKAKEDPEWFDELYKRKFN